MGQPHAAQEDTDPVPALRHPRLARTAPVAVAALLLGWTVLSIVLNELPRNMADELALSGRALCGALFAAAGGLRLARWRLTGEARSAWAGAGLLVLGLGLPLLPLITDLAADNPQAMTRDPQTRLGLVVVVLAIIIGASRSRHSANSVRPVRLILLAMGGLGVVAVAGAQVRHAASGGLGAAGPLTAGELGAAAMWAWLGTLAWRAGRRTGRVTHIWAGYFGAMMALSECARIGSFGQIEPMWSIASGLQLAAATWAVLTAACELLDAFAHHGSRLLRAVEQLDQVREDQRERLHDARSVLLGLDGAVRNLAAPTRVARVTDTAAAMQAELSRLRHVLETDHVTVAETFYLGAALEPVLLTHRLAGGRVTTDGAEATAFGNSAATATVVGNLLCNVRAHAPKARVHVHAATLDERTTVWVDDDGPGIAPLERARVLRRGERGSGAGPDGSGLGLYTAARLMRAQGGTLCILDRPGGGTRVELTLPAGPALPMAANDR